MRIAYITPYKGPTLVERRPVVQNLSLSNTIKIETIARLLRDASHDVEVISQGEVVQSHFWFYPGFFEAKRFHPDIPVYYSSALPIRFINGFWASMRTLQFFRSRHRISPYDLVIIFNLKRPHITCANYSIRRQGIPVILEDQDDSFVNVVGQTSNGILSKYHQSAYAGILKTVSGCMAVSPHLLSQLPSDIPKLLLRGVVADDILKTKEKMSGLKKNWIVFAGTHTHSNGVAELISAWESLRLPDWELHITGHGKMTEQLEQMAQGIPGIIFRGLVSREELVRILCSAKICINPHAVSKTPGNVFAFKIIEYLGAGAHVVTTPMGELEKEIENGISYMPDNRPETIAATLRAVITTKRWEQNAAQAVYDTYSPGAVAKSIDALVRKVMTKCVG